MASEGVNKVILLGNLGADPELKTTDRGGILKLRVATSKNWKNEQGERQEKTEWHNVTIFGKRADALAKILKKGERVFIEGELRTSSYEKDGEKRYSTDIVANELVLNGTKPKAGGDGPQTDEPQTKGDDEIPF